ncbi:cation diffusion facilitator family transporter [Glycomyces arizonensis]|uniref:cation diffusion facilitator family transporter n=1 Tax=Glycomyces arizonensis TaxID=256035 RepID=UPI00041BC168|nr:cation transporter [Glycomyces arizonensis]
MARLPLAPITPGRRDRLTRIVRALVAATITYNVVEAVIALWAGTLASSTALIGFGLDSVVEVSSALAVAWQFSARDHAAREAREHRALKVIAVSFFALAAYVTYESATALYSGHQAEHSAAGIVLAAVSLAVMPFLSWAQRRAGRELGSATAVADSKQTLLCTYLSAVVLAGLVVNSLFGWWWADPVAALAIAAVAVKEGREAWKGDNCCAPAGLAATADSAEDAGCADGCCTPSPAAAPPAPLRLGREGGRVEESSPRPL